MNFMRNTLWSSSLCGSTSVSKDDDGARPFITLNVEPEDADRNVLIRFEITSHGGEALYVHEMKAFLRDGEMSIMADHHLPLAGNPRIQGMGDWDLRVFLDGNLIGLHNFTLAPSMRERNRRLAGDYQEDRAVDEAPADEFDIIDELKQERAPKPPTLQDLLQEQRSSRLSGSESSNSSSSVNSDREPRRLSNTPRRRR